MASEDKKIIASAKETAPKVQAPLAAPAVKAEAPAKEAAPVKAGKPGRKPRVKKAEDAKPVAEKKTKAAKAAPTEEVFIEYNQASATPASLIARAKEDWLANGGKEADIKTIKVYVNTNEGMVYYVINESAGHFQF